MKNKTISDYNHPLVKETASKLIESKKTIEEKLESIFLYVRDDILFGFLEEIDDYRASDIIKTGKGQCNNKAALFLALCKASGIKARIHYSGIRKEIQRGLFKGIVYRLMPDEISHSWIEVYVRDQWIRLDSFINDLPFYLSGKEELKRRGWKTGLSVSCGNGESNADFSLENDNFVQMGAITSDHGTYGDPAEYYGSSHYQNNPGTLKKIIYRLALKGINKRVDELRSKEKFDQPI